MLSETSLKWCLVWLICRKDQSKALILPQTANTQIVHYKHQILQGAWSMLNFGISMPQRREPRFPLHLRFRFPSVSMVFPCWMVKGFASFGSWNLGLQLSSGRRPVIRTLVSNCPQGAGKYHEVLLRCNSPSPICEKNRQHLQHFGSKAHFVWSNPRRKDIINIQTPPMIIWAVFNISCLGCIHFNLVRVWIEHNHGLRGIVLCESPIVFRGKCQKNKHKWNAPY